MTLIVGHLYCLFTGVFVYILYSAVSCMHVGTCIKMRRRCTVYRRLIARDFGTITDLLSTLEQYWRACAPITDRLSTLG